MIWIVKIHQQKNGESSKINNILFVELYNKKCMIQNKNCTPETPLNMEALKKNSPQFQQGKIHLNENTDFTDDFFLGSRAPLDPSKVLLPHTVAATVPAIGPWKSPLV